MTSLPSTTGRRDGDDDDSNPLQGESAGVETGDYAKKPDYIPGETEAVDNSQQ